MGSRAGAQRGTRRKKGENNANKKGTQTKKRRRHLQTGHAIFDVAGPLLWCCCKDGNVLSVVQPHQCLHLPPATQNGRKAIRNLRCASRTAPVGHEMQLTKLPYFAQSPQSFASVGAALLGACESWICISFSGTQNGRKAIRNLRCASRTAPVRHEMQLTKLLYFAQSPQSFASVGAALLGACESWICISFSGTQNGRKAIRNLRCASRTAPVGHEMQLTKLLYFAQSHATISDQQQQIEDAPPGWHLSANFQGGRSSKPCPPYISANVHLWQQIPLNMKQSSTWNVLR